LSNQWPVVERTFQSVHHLRKLESLSYRFHLALRAVKRAKYKLMSDDKEILNNRQAFHEYHILDKYEAGAVLQGTEVKSMMAGRIQLKDAYVNIRDGEVWLLNAHISPYSHGNRQNHEPLRTRKLLLHRREIEKLEKETTQKGMTLVVTRIYWKNGRIKFEIGVAKGKKLYDKRETEMRKTIDKETRQQLKEKLR
jgi:SsrA-binding protein